MVSVHFQEGWSKLHKKVRPKHAASRPFSNVCSWRFGANRACRKPTELIAFHLTAGIWVIALSCLSVAAVRLSRDHCVGHQSHIRPLQVSFVAALRIRAAQYSPFAFICSLVFGLCPPLQPVSTLLNFCSPLFPILWPNLTCRGPQPCLADLHTACRHTIKAMQAPPHSAEAAT